MPLTARSRTGQGAPRRVAGAPGLSFNEDKTRIAHLSDGFDFLGFNVRHYRNPGKLLIKPSKAAVKRFRARLRAEVRSLHGTNAMAVISRLNPILRGWAGYYRRLCPRRSSGHRFHPLVDAVQVG